MGRSRGGLTTKIHPVTDANGLPIHLAIVSSETHDTVPAKELLSDVQNGHVDPRQQSLRRRLDQATDRGPGRDANIASKWKACFSAVLYKGRNFVERFFNKLKLFRRIVTRFDKLGSTIRAMIKLASIRIWLRAYKSRAQKEIQFSR